MAGSDQGMVVVGLDNLSIGGSFLDYSRVYWGGGKKTKQSGKKGWKICCGCIDYSKKY